MKGLKIGSSCPEIVAMLSIARREKNLVSREGILTYTRNIDNMFCFACKSTPTMRRLRASKKIYSGVDILCKPLLLGSVMYLRSLVFGSSSGLAPRTDQTRAPYGS